MSPIGKGQLVLQFLHGSSPTDWSLSAQYSEPRENLIWTLVRKHAQDKAFPAEPPTNVCVTTVVMHGTILSPPSIVRQGNSFRPRHLSLLTSTFHNLRLNPLFLLESTHSPIPQLAPLNPAKEMIITNWWLLEGIRVRGEGYRAGDGKYRWRGVGDSGFQLRNKLKAQPREYSQWD